MRLTTREPDTQLAGELRAPVLREMLPDHDRLSARDQLDLITRCCASLDPHPARIELELRDLLGAHLFDYKPVLKHPDAFVIDSVARIHGKRDAHRQQFDTGE